MQKNVSASRKCSWQEQGLDGAVSQSSYELPASHSSGEYYVDDTELTHGNYLKVPCVDVSDMVVDR